MGEIDKEEACTECGKKFRPEKDYDLQGDPPQYVPCYEDRCDECVMKGVRYARHYVLLHPSDCDPPHRLDLAPGSRDSRKVEWLEEAFKKDSFDQNKSALVGYPKNGRIQLLSGTHRHEAARRADIRLPVAIKLRSVVEAAWGTDSWEELIRDIPVSELEHYPIEDGLPPGIDERVDLERDMRPVSQ